jgi:prophage regulatory protein
MAFDSTSIRFLRLPAVIQATGLKRSMIYRLQAENRFPHSVRITDRAVGWVESDVQRWLSQRVVGGQIVDEGRHS